MASLDDGARIVVLSGAGLSAASGIPTFRDADGLWRGTPVEEVAAPEAWFADRELVRCFYDERRVSCVSVMPNPGHEAVARLQHRLGAKRVTLVTQNIDGLLQKAAANEVIEMHGSLWKLRCERDELHPTVGIAGRQSRSARCAVCGAFLRPAVVWFGEIPQHLDRIYEALVRCRVFISVGTSGTVYPAAGFVRIAAGSGAECIEVNPRPTGGHFDRVLAEGAETALPRLVGEWLAEG